MMETPAQKESSVEIYGYDADALKRTPLTEVRGLLFASSDGAGLSDAFSEENHFTLGEGQGIFRGDYSGISAEQWNQAILEQDLKIEDLNLLKARYELETSKTDAALLESGFTLLTAPKVESKLIEIRNNAMKAFSPLPFIENTSNNYLSNSREN